MRRILFAAMMLAAALPAFGQQRAWTLEECIEYALEHNISVKQSSLNVEQREIELSTAKSSYMPAVATSLSQNFSFGRGLTEDNTYRNVNTTNTSLSLGAELPLFDGFRKKNNLIYSKLNLSAATEDLEKIKDDIRTSVAGAYVQILYNTEILGVARRQVGIDSLQVVRLEQMTLNGKASEAELAQQKAALAASRLQAVEAENSLSMSLLEMTQLLELDSPEGFAVAAFPEEAFDAVILESAQDIYEQALGIRPAIRSEQLRLDAAQTNISIAKAGYYPSLSLSGGLGSNYYTSAGMSSSGFFSQLQTNFSQYMGLSLNVPIFSRFSTKNNVKSAQISFNNQQLQLESAKKALFKEIQQAYYNALASRSKFESSREAAASAEEAFRLTSAKYENGKANITEFESSKVKCLEAESNLVRARYEYIYQTNLLEFYRGFRSIR